MTELLWSGSNGSTWSVKVYVTVDDVPRSFTLDLFHAKKTNTGPATVRKTGGNLLSDEWASVCGFGEIKTPTFYNNEALSVERCSIESGTFPNSRGKSWRTESIPNGVAPNGVTPDFKPQTSLEI